MSKFKFKYLAGSLDISVSSNISSTGIISFSIWTFVVDIEKSRSHEGIRPKERFLRTFVEPKIRNFLCFI